MGVISSLEIWRRLFDEDDENESLVITPLLDPKGQIQEGSSSVDVRLGTHFLIQRRTDVTIIEPGKIIDSHPSVTKIDIPFGGKFILHPNQFALGCTLEYFKMPFDLSAYIITRSSWGRLGLVVATAIGIHPGFKGIITLELRNLGEVPFVLRPGRRIAQAFFHHIEGELTQEGVRTYSMGDSIPQVTYNFPDKDLEILENLGNQ